ncbi:5'-nucleotidase C-terminal domain-containing protein [Myxococcota bacterium]|nr:5'-nucleotidase C-terminal domain-containing protein [Myxococcota bacterium]
MKKLIGFVAVLAFGAMCVACGDNGGGEDVLTDVIEDIGTADTETADTVADDVAVDVPVVHPIDWDAWLNPTEGGFPDDGKKRVVILHTNDMHSHINGTGPVLDYSPDTILDDETVGGLARVASLVERQKAYMNENTDMIIVDGGDFSFGTAFTFLAQDTGIELRMMDDIGYVATTIGNHEMDWTPAGLAGVITKGLEGASNLTVLSSNLVYSDESADDDALAALVGDKVKPYKVVTLGNGLKVGLFGLIGEKAIDLSPHATPVTARALKDAAQETIDTLRNTEGVDLVVALSHSGVSEGGVIGEDQTLAKKVTGLDVIISGHTHTYLEEPIVENGTTIVQAGCYTRYLGRLVLVENGEGGYAVESWESLPIDDSIPGWPAVIEAVDDYTDMLGETAFAELGVGYADGVATTSFDMMPLEMSESGIGNFIADCVRYAAEEFTGEPFDVAIEANGVIRDGLKMGDTGIITLGDIIQVLPLGIGLDHEVGYPLISIYLTAAELKTAAEIIVGVATMFSDSFFLQISGFRFEYKESADPFVKVKTIYMADGNGGYESTPLDMSEANTTLYRVATNLYIGQMLGLVKSYLGGMITLDPKNAEGVPYTNIEDAIIDIDPATEGVQELKLWRAVFEAMKDLDKPEGAELPAVPAEYGTDLDRQKTVN